MAGASGLQSLHETIDEERQGVSMAHSMKIANYPLHKFSVITIQVMSQSRRKRSKHRLNALKNRLKSKQIMALRRGSSATLRAADPVI